MAMYPRFISWKRKLRDEVSSADEFFSPRALSRIRADFSTLATTTYRLVREGVDDAYLDRFIPVYEAHIGAKKHGHIYDVRGTIMSGVAQGNTYESVSLFKGEEFIGGFIYRVTERALSSCYRAFPHKIDCKLTTGVAIMAEHMFFDRALELGVGKMLHGKDRNAFGLHSNVGLAAYKLRLGYKPYFSKADDNELLPFPMDCNGEDTLVFLGDQVGKRLLRGVLVSDASLDELLLRYRPIIENEVVPIEIIPHSALEAWKP